MFDTDKFIECVQGIPPLWDKRVAEYSDKIIRDRAWIEIGIVMYEDWNCTTLRERDDRVKEMKNKWRHIRDHFFRVLNKGKSGDVAPSKRKKYVYADSLSFLMNYETKRPTSNNIAATEDENIDKPQKSQVLEEAEEITQVAVRPYINIRQDALKQKKVSPFQSQLPMKLDTSSANEEDVDRLYLLSMLSDFKGLTDTQKLDFKMMNLQFFRNIKSMPQYQTLPMMSPPNPQPQSTVVMPPSKRQSRMPPMIRWPGKSRTPEVATPSIPWSGDSSTPIVGTDHTPWAGDPATLGDAPTTSQEGGDPLSRVVKIKQEFYYEDEESIDISGTPASTSQVAEVEDPLVSRTSEQYAQYVASKLSKMDSYQCIYAENLINQVLFKGALDNLRENTTLYTPPDS